MTQVDSEFIEDLMIRLSSYRWTCKNRLEMKKSNSKIVIDEENKLTFDNEEQLYAHFSKDIELLEDEFLKWRSSQDLPEEDFVQYEEQLSMLLDDPDEVWVDEETISGSALTIFLKAFETDDDQELFHVAVAYMADNQPSFIYLHFPTRDLNLVERYQRGDFVYSRAHIMAPQGALEGDALSEGELLASGLYEAMLLVRSSSDLPESEFKSYAELREEAIQEADEIWRNTDSMGNVLVSFIKDFHDVEEDLHYVAVTVEDTPTNSHALLFSFPTKDVNLLERYRHGENLQAEEVIQESSH